jgi:hypothetical protein
MLSERSCATESIVGIKDAIVGNKDASFTTLEQSGYVLQAQCGGHIERRPNKDTRMVTERVKPPVASVKGKTGSKDGRRPKGHEKSKDERRNK